MSRNPIARDLRTPKYRSRRIPHKRLDARPVPIEQDDWHCPHCDMRWDFEEHERCPCCSKSPFEPPSLSNR